MGLLIPAASTGFVRFVPQGAAGAKSPKESWIFCATLRDGSQFAIDLCNAQYNMTTAQEHTSGVFPWEQYMQRLAIPGGIPVKTQHLVYCFTDSVAAKFKGTAQDADAGRFVEEDLRIAAQVRASGTLNITLMALPLSNKMGYTLAQLMSLKSAEFDIAAAKFKACQSASMGFLRDTIDRGDVTWILTERLHKGGWYESGS